MRRAVAIGLLVITAALAAPSEARAQRGGPTGGPFGLGIVIGEPTGISAALRLHDAGSLQLHLGFGFRKNRGRVAIVLDYLYHFWGVIPPIQGAGILAPYVGIGGRLGIAESDAAFGVLFPLGLSFGIKNAPIELFAEVGIGIYVVPETTALVNGGLGARFYF